GAATHAAPPQLSTHEDQREVLGGSGHRGLVLSRHGFRPLAEGRSRADAPALAALLASSFRAQALHQPREVRLANDLVDIVRQQDAGDPPVVLTREEFIARLLDYRRLFARPPKVQLALMTLAPKERGNLDSPWEGT